MEKKFIKDLVSVIIPMYNSEKYIKKSIISVENQTYKNIEIILVDDNSIDNTEIIVKDLQGKYDNIVYYKQYENRGAGVSRNKALELAKGQYVAFLDSDDVWYPDKIFKQIKLMREKKSPFGYAAIEMIDKQGQVIKSKRKVRVFCTYSYLLKNTIIATSSVIVDRHYYGDFRMSNRRGGQDYSTWLRLLREGVIAVGINETLVQYRVTNDSLSSNKFKSIRQVWEIQTQDEGINKVIAMVDIVAFVYHALIKYLKD